MSDALAIIADAINPHLSGGKLRSRLNALTLAATVITELEKRGFAIIEDGRLAELHWAEAAINE